MAKTESTAVNALIDQMQSGKPQQTSEPAADLFSAPPKSTKVNPPRMTSPIPPMRGAGEVEPLPPRRAPHSTAQQRPVAPPVRMSTADPARGNTIPPLSRPPSSPAPRSSGSALPPPRARATASNPAVRPSAPPPPQRASSPRPSAANPSHARPSSPRPSSARASSPSARSVPSLPSLPPPSAPVAAPFETKSETPFASVPALPQQYPVIARPRTIDATGDVIKADNWFDVSAAIPRVDEPAWDGTSVVQRPQRDTLALVKKLIAPTIVLVIIGIMVGGFFAFDGDGGKKKTSAAPAAAGEAATADVHTMAAAPTPADPTAQPALAEQAAQPAVAAAEPPTKAEDVAKQAAAAVETATQAAAAAAPAPASESMIPAATAAAITRDAPAANKAKLEAKAAAPAAPAAPAAAASAAPAAPASSAAPAAPAPSSPTAVPAPPAETPIAVKSVKTSSEAPQVREVRTARGVVKLVDVRIDSKPSGATVMLVDSGKTSFLGSTPLATSLDPAKKYDVIFTLEGRPTQMAPLDPAKTSRLDVTLGRAKSGSSRKSEAAPSLTSFVDKPPKADAKAKKAEPKLAEPSFEAPRADAKDAKKAEPAAIEVVRPGKASEAKPDKADKAEAKLDLKKTDKKAVAAAPGGDGTLMVSSKPPCELIIDGKPTGLTTPQKAIPLSAGVHKVTFVNEAAGIKKTVSVSITADQTSKLIQDLMKK